MSLNTPIHDWHGQRVWVVGASSGIGAALAQQLLTQGAHVAMSSRRAELLKEVAGDRADAHVIPFDAMDQAEWEDAYQQVLSQLGGLDMLLFCAADYKFE